ncbi:MAG: hypothetical protein ACI9FN_000745 [Saprospiraceae bacterium]|jgi:hypothetical protein
MSTEVLSDGKTSPTFELPFVVADLINNDITDEVHYHYFGNDTHFSTPEFYPTDLVNDNSCSCKPSVEFNPLDVSLVYITDDSIIVTVMTLGNMGKVFLQAETALKIVEGTLQQGATMQVIMKDCNE